LPPLQENAERDGKGLWEDAPVSRMQSAYGDSQSAGAVEVSTPHRVVLTEHCRD
jgi:hypothetical protein